MGGEALAKPAARWPSPPTSEAACTSWSSKPATCGDEETTAPSNGEAEVEGEEADNLGDDGGVDEPMGRPEGVGGQTVAGEDTSSARRAAAGVVRVRVFTCPLAGLPEPDGPNENAPWEAQS